MPKKPYAPPVPPECGKASLGLPPSVLAKREKCDKNNTGCPTQVPYTARVDYDHWCDPNQPKSVIYKDVVKAHSVIKETIQNTPLLMPKSKNLFDMELYLKIETLHESGSFHERSAIYALYMLSDEERADGVYTASIGNWGMALAHVGKKKGIKVTVVLPIKTSVDAVRRTQDYGAKVVISGQNLEEARLEAFNLIKQHGAGTYINGYDHPHVIAGAGSIGIELMEQLPNIDAILIPVGGGGLLAGIATVVKTLKPDTLIYGVESYESCCFFKAMDNEKPYATECSITAPLAVPTAGYNAFHTARSLIDKMVLVHSNWMNQVILRMAEEERYIVEVSGAVALAALFAKPYIVPELRDKRVVCIVTGANIACIPLSRALEHGLAVEGRSVSIKISLPNDNTKEYYKVLKIIANVGCNIIHYDSDNVWSTEDDLFKSYMTVMCSTRGLQHSCTLKRVMEKLFPNKCQFADVPFCGTTKCPCFPKLWPL
ncbi:unnamed protein product [Arctia plantaginis]|uniref:L-serine deaminase n=1 Tax=Arctia plantaginis TaxID=874455 RepID=A0A8S1AW48_ARCPL|nr:unnamed protein product [Arctia plantaginis]